MTGSATRNTPQKPPRKMHKKDAGVEEEAFRNEKKSASRLRTARDTFGHKKTTHKPERVEVELPEVEVSMSAEYE
ncbi:unnamed protein product, partial [Anisakis simplex]|uniref:Uncharacterized protein n=1 Tax=Anisakis simplex TaxID=6269 RepID=A0A0M3JKV1_ANISI